MIAHLTMAARYSEEEFMAELGRCNFDFTRLSNEIVSRDAELPVADLVANMRTDTMHHWTPPGGGYHGALNHVVIHGLDITVPLGVPRRSSDEAIRVILDDLTQGGGHEHFGIEIEGRSLRATDLDWSYGSGPPLSGSAEDVALAVCGRTVPDGRLEGERLHRGAPRLMHPFSVVPAAGYLVTVITVQEGGATYGVNSWRSSPTDVRRYREGSS